MAAIMTKRGSQDNIVTYEHFCDTKADLAKIDSKYITLGSVAVIIHGDAGLEIYIADSDKQWVDLSAASSNDEASSPEVDQGQADSMVLGE